MRGIFFILMPAWLYSYTYTVATYVLTKYIINLYESTEVWKWRNISRKKYLIGSNQFWSEISPVFRGLTSWHIYEALIKSRHCEKATKFEKISHLFWRNSCFYPVASKKVGDFFQILWPFQKTWTLFPHKYGNEEISRGNSGFSANSLKSIFVNRMFFPALFTLFKLI